MAVLAEKNKGNKGFYLNNGSCQ